ncbi:flagellar hook-basal body protein [Comamonas sediminis]|uniref:Flagellar hook-basal body protein n=1 Tax=Comamonas sediminis TaxID=1783360 RepID=A0ABV4B263_9BURK
MQEILAITLQSMQQDMRQLDNVASNLANALTPGYQRGVTSNRPMGPAATTFAEMVDGMGKLPSDAASTSVASALRLQVDQRPGSLKQTGQPLDIALAGPGYFEVNTNTGPAYTRQGNFHLDARGRLVTAQGHAVMGKGGEIFLNNDHPAIDPVGNLYDQEKSRGSGSSPAPLVPQSATLQQALDQLKVVQPEASTEMSRLSSGLMKASGPMAMVNDRDVQLKQGFLEGSNVEPRQEMVQLIQTMRHFESMQKVSQGYDDLMGQAIRKLGDLS